MTDPRSAQPGSYRTSGHGAETGRETRVAALSGRASARPGRPGAASPAGWSPPPAGEAAPPVRHRGPARSDGASGVPEARWLSLTRLGPRHIPVVGPTEALHGRPGGPGMVAPRGPVPGPPGHQRKSGWQLAHQVWQEAGVDWEAVTVPYQPGPHEPEQVPARPVCARGCPTCTSMTCLSPPRTGPIRTSPAPMSRPGRARPGRARYEPGWTKILTGTQPDPAFPDDEPADARVRGGRDPGTRVPGLLFPDDAAVADQPATGATQADTHATRPDLPILREPADSRFGIGPWPVQQPAAVTQPQPVLADEPAPDEPGEADRARSP